MQRKHELFDEGWKFELSDVTGGERPGLDDSGWRTLDLPHDWSVEDLPRASGPFDAGAVGGRSTGFAVGGSAWYRKRFRLPVDFRGKRVRILFEGAYMNTRVWLNGEHVGDHPYGYTSFHFDLTPKIKFGAENVLAVQVRNEGKNTRWYSGSGIYRHVWLTVTEPVNVAQWGIYVTTPLVTDKRAEVRVRTTIQNETGAEKNLSLRTTLLDRRGKPAARSESALAVGAGENREFDQLLEVSRPALWSPDSPALYTAVSEVLSGGKIMDRVLTDFGIREISFDAKNGFRLNGKAMLLKGACMHHDNGCLGAAAFDDAEDRRVRQMKENGYNAIRTAHNPPSPRFLEACDRAGILVIDETFDMWERPKNPEDYHLHFKDCWKRDVASMVLRDRNHPSVIVWSIGNEIPERGTELGLRNGRMQAEYVRSLDPTRPVTEAVCGSNFPWEDFDKYFDNLDVCGYNYKRDKYVSDHGRAPDRLMCATESFPMEAFEYWMAVLDYPWVFGDFVWTGYDYLGEAAIGWWSYDGEPKQLFPWTVAYCGDLDLCGFKRPQSYYRDVLWKTGSKLSIFVHNPEPTFGARKNVAWGWDDVHASWNWPGREGRKMKVDVYSGCERVKLFLNGKSLGEKRTSRKTKFKASWRVPYAPGTLKAIGYEGAKQVAQWELKSAKEPAKVKLSAERKTIRADGQSLCFVSVEVLDKSGVRHPNANNLVEFKIEGPATLAGVGSGNPVNVASFQRPQCRTFEGRCIAVIKAGRKPGRITLTASSRGMVSDRVTVVSKR